MDNGHKNKCLRQNEIILGCGDRVDLGGGELVVKLCKFLGFFCYGAQLGTKMIGFEMVIWTKTGVDANLMLSLGIVHSLETANGGILM